MSNIIKYGTTGQTSGIAVFLNPGRDLIKLGTVINIDLDNAEFAHINHFTGQKILTLYMDPFAISFSDFDTFMDFGLADLPAGYIYRFICGKGYTFDQWLRRKLSKAQIQYFGTTNNQNFMQINMEYSSQPRLPIEQQMERLGLALENNQAALGKFTPEQLYPDNKPGEITVHIEVAGDTPEHIKELLFPEENTEQ